MNEEARTYWDEYCAACHAMQSGVAARIELGAEDATPKHLRVGINSSMVENSALLQMLLDKGIFTETEFLKRLRDGMRREVERYERGLGMKLL